MKACVSCAKPISALREQDKCRHCWQKQYAQVCRPVARTLDDDDDKPKRGDALREANSKAIEVLKAKKRKPRTVDKICAYVPCGNIFPVDQAEARRKRKEKFYCTRKCYQLASRKTKCA